MLKRILEKIKINEDGEIHDENQYISLINDILNYGTIVTGRNGNALTIFGSAMHFNLENNVMPILTTKRVAWKTCAKELFWFLKGSTDNKLLQNENVNIWNANASRDFLDSRNLQHLEENDLGPVYGHQWRFFNADYTDCHTNYKDKGIDQLQYIIDCLKDPVERYSRRLVMSAWNPEQLNEMALPPCHILAQFNVIGNELSCSLYQRSGDVGLGIPFNIASYSFLTHILAKHCDLEAKQFIHFIGDAHIYEEHVDVLSEQIKRKPYDFPTVEIKKKCESINNYTLEDIVVNNYKFNKKIKMEMKS